MAQYLNRYRVQIPIGWQGKTLPVGAQLIASPVDVAKLLESGAIHFDTQAHIDEQPIIAPQAINPASNESVSDDDIQDMALLSASEQELNEVNDDQVDAKTTVNLHTLKLDELKQTATELDLDTTGAKTKADYVALLVPHVTVSDSEVVE